MGECQGHMHGSVMVYVMSIHTVLPLGRVMLLLGVSACFGNTGLVKARIVGVGVRYAALEPRLSKLLCRWVIKGFQ